MDLTIDQALLLADKRFHAIPPQGYTIAQAHTVMRKHLECRSWSCPAKGYALDVLVLEGRIHPDYEQYETWAADIRTVVKPALAEVVGEWRSGRRQRRLAKQ